MPLHHSSENCLTSMPKTAATGFLEGCVWDKRKWQFWRHRIATIGILSAIGINGSFKRFPCIHFSTHKNKVKKEEEKKK